MYFKTTSLKSLVSGFSLDIGLGKGVSTQSAAQTTTSLSSIRTAFMKLA